MALKLEARLAIRRWARPQQTCLWARNLPSRVHWMRREDGGEDVTGMECFWVPARPGQGQPGDPQIASLQPGCSFTVDCRVKLGVSGSLRISAFSWSSITRRLSEPFHVNIMKYSVTGGLHTLHFLLEVLRLAPWVFVPLFYVQQAQMHVLVSRGLENTLDAVRPMSECPADTGFLPPVSVVPCQPPRWDPLPLPYPFLQAPHSFRPCTCHLACLGPIPAWPTSAACAKRPEMLPPLGDLSWCIGMDSLLVSGTVAASPKQTGDVREGCQNKIPNGQTLTGLRTRARAEATCCAGNLAL